MGGERERKPGNGETTIIVDNSLTSIEHKALGTREKFEILRSSRNRWGKWRKPLYHEPDLEYMLFAPS